MFVSTPKTWSDSIKNTARGLLPAVAVLGALSVASAVSAEDYALDIDRQLSAGQQFTIEGEAYNNTEMVQIFGEDDPIEENTSSEINLEGEMEILAVDEEGGVTRLVLRVTDYDIEYNDEGIELSPGKRLLLEVDGNEVLLTYEDGSALSDEAWELLHDLLSDLLDKEGYEEDDRQAAMLGIDQPRSPGEKWEIDPEQFSGEMNDEDGGMVLDNRSEVGDNECHFVELDTRAFGEEVAVIELELEVAGFGFTPGVFPEVFEVEESEIEFNAEFWTPLEPTSGQMREEFEMEAAYRISGVIPEEKVKLVLDVEVEAGRTIVLRRIDD